MNRELLLAGRIGPERRDLERKLLDVLPPRHVVNAIATIVDADGRALGESPWELANLVIDLIIVWNDLTIENDAVTCHDSSERAVLTGDRVSSTIVLGEPQLCA
jgi:hypothetical protein